ncbi:MAG TPA: class D beta-lactamase [Rudaea sp.]|jgi:beta-lactamase class D
MREWMLLLVLLPLGAMAAGPNWQEHADWKAEFAGRQVPGTVLIYDEQADRYDVFDRARAQTPMLPASTFKVFNALVALETGAVKDEYEVIRWDGVKRQFDGWNRDHSLASAMKFSAVWFYQEMARRAGQERMQEWVDKAGYGNRDIGGGIDQFWLGGKIRISAAQQIEFLRRLAHGSLPFSERAQEAVRRITIVEAAPDYVMHGKTGWAPKGNNGRTTDLGWYIGWIERGGRRWFHALNIDMPQGGDDAAKRQLIAKALLVRAGALPQSDKP